MAVRKASGVGTWPVPPCHIRDNDLCGAGSSRGLGEGQRDGGHSTPPRHARRSLHEPSTNAQEIQKKIEHKSKFRCAILCLVRSGCAGYATALGGISGFEAFRVFLQQNDRKATCDSTSRKTTVTMSLQTEIGFHHIAGGWSCPMLSLQSILTVWRLHSFHCFPY